MRKLKLIVPASLVLVGFVASTATSYGKLEYLTKEKKNNPNITSCTSCHIKVGAADAMKKDPNLNDVGQCYSKNDHSLAKCTVPPAKK
jgi:cytochrome c553